MFIRFLCYKLTSDRGGFELASTITLLLQATRLTKCASNPELQVAAVKFQIDWIVNWINLDASFLKDGLFLVGDNPPSIFFRTIIAVISKQQIYRSQQPPPFLPATYE